MSPETLIDILLRTLLVAGVATAIATPPALGLAWLLARREFAGRWLVQTLVTLPLVMPPVAIGVLLLKVLSPQRPWAEGLYALMFGNPLFTWRAAAIAALVMGFPLLVRTSEAAFAAVPRRLELAAMSLGASRLRVFVQVTLPLALRGVLYGIVLCFLRGIGEFGATTLVAGNVPGQTETLSLAIYSRTNSFQDAEALLLCAIASIFALATTVLAEVFLRRTPAEDRHPDTQLER